MQQRRDIQQRHPVTPVEIAAAADGDRIEPGLERGFARIVTAQVLERVDERVLRDVFGANPPAATMIECGLIDPKYRIEIEVTAVLPD